MLFIQIRDHIRGPAAFRRAQSPCPSNILPTTKVGCLVQGTQVNDRRRPQGNEGVHPSSPGIHAAGWRGGGEWKWEVVTDSWPVALSHVCLAALEAVPGCRCSVPTSGSSGSSRHQAVGPAPLLNLVSVNYVRAHPETRFICISGQGIRAHGIRACGRWLAGGTIYPGFQRRPAAGSSERCCRQPPLLIPAQRGGLDSNPFPSTY